MTTSSSLSCVRESWDVSNVDQFRDYDYLGNNDFEDITYNFYIGNARNNVKLKAVLSEDSSESLNLAIMLNDPDPNTSVIVRLCDVKFIAEFGEITRASQYLRRGAFNARPDSGVVELGIGECRVDTNMTLSTIRDRTFNTLRIEFSLCNSLITNQTKVEDCVSTNIQGDFQQFGFQTLTDFESMLNDTATADVAIKVTLGEEKIFRCHKFILTARSPVFRAMFESQMKEAADNVVVIKDISAPTMEHFLSFLYCGRFQDESWIKVLPNLTYVAHKYEVASLKQLCDLHLIKSVTNTNALAIGNLAQCYELTNALGQIKEFVRNNAGELNFDFANASEGLQIGQ